jgi:membrane protein implicated in regulation of membrane protease activity
MNKFFKIMELLWLTGAIVGVGLAVYFLIIKDSDSALYFVFFFIVASIMYLTRRYQRVNQDKRNQAPPRK